MLSRATAGWDPSSVVPSARGASWRVPLPAKGVLLIDDVVASGGQAREAIRALSAADWRFAALAQATASPGRTGHRCER
jgi:adenine/guanine phosphoribosyltransferase-like PRPP-binding protein